MKILMSEDPPVYPVEPWQISETDFSLKRNLLSETIFTLANGYIGIRGTFEEGLNSNDKKAIDGIYLNGFYESVPIPHTERGHGFAGNTQTRLNVTDSKIIELEIDGEHFSMDSGTVTNYRRTLNLKEGYLTRELTWRSPGGREIRINVRRLVPFKHRHLLMFAYTIEPLNFSGPISIISALDGAVDNHTHVENDPRFSASLGNLKLKVKDLFTTGTGATLTQETNRSNLALACAMQNRIISGAPARKEICKSDHKASIRFSIDAGKGEQVTLYKYVSYYTTRDYPISAIRILAETAVKEAKKTGFESFLKEQKEYCLEYWESLGVNIEGDPKNEQGIRFNLFHLLQAAGNKGQTSIAAKGLTSEGYDGHYFWDAEIYLVPFFASTRPDEARKLLEFRYSILDHARERARELSHDRGALFPWRTIAGEEGSSYFPAGTAQYHINAAIAYAINKYVETTDDFSAILDFGAEILFETARLWEDLGTYVPRKGNRFCFNEVTGPDEYSALVNNNCYTNLMAQWHLRFAYNTAQLLKRDHPRFYSQLAQKIALQEEELQSWLMAAEYMYVPYDESLQIHPQDDGFLDKEAWNFATTPPENYPLLLHYHPLVIYRFQVCKQPDVILAHLLLNDRFPREQKKRDYDYYEPITTHDSTLSPSIFSIISSELGYEEDACRFFSISARLDLDNIMKATHYGIHIANMAGSWLCLVNGFAGMRCDHSQLKFNPCLPPGIKSYSFNISFQGCRLKVMVREGETQYRLLQGDTIAFTHGAVGVTLARGDKKTLPIEQQS